MIEHDKLMTALFDNADREHVDVKFCVGGATDISTEDFCREAASMLAQMDAGIGADEEFLEDFTPRPVSEFLSSN